MRSAFWIPSRTAGNERQNDVGQFKFGLVHAPVTPFANGRIDLAGYGNVLDFHLAGGAQGVALPMHSGESVSLTVAEREALLEFALKHVDGRVPVIANVSEAGTGIATSLASHAGKVGAAAVIATVPYYWTPPQHMLVEHFIAIGEAAKLPLFVLNSPAEMNEVEIASKSVVDLLVRSSNMAGLIDLSLDWQYMIEVMTVARAARPDFQLVSGTEYMISAAAVGATGLLSPLASVAPKLIESLYKLCMVEKFTEARSAQERAAILYRAFRDAGVAGFKTGMRAMGRDCGAPRPPLSALSEADTKVLLAELSAAGTMKTEPGGWV
jgi:4-hydroxy-tetrahydrodipicolinate synthase